MYCVAYDKEDYAYVVHMTSKKYEELSKHSDDEMIELNGVTKKPSSDMKKYAIDFLNVDKKRNDEKYTIDDYEDYFGDVYLELKDEKSILLYIFMAIVIGGTLYEIVRFVRAEMWLRKKPEDGEEIRINE